MSAMMPPALARLIDEFGIDAPVDPERLIVEFERDNAERTCVGCGCTNARACIDPETGESCSWVEGAGVDVCNVCAGLAQRIVEIEDEEFAADKDPRGAEIEVVSPSQAQRYIERTRAARMGAGA